LEYVNRERYLRLFTDITFVFVLIFLKIIYVKARDSEQRASDAALDMKSLITLPEPEGSNKRKRSTKEDAEREHNSDGKLNFYVKQLHPHVLANYLRALLIVKSGLHVQGNRNRGLISELLPCIRRS
jgi:hypothetical protein